MAFPKKPQLFAIALGAGVLAANGLAMSAEPSRNLLVLYPYGRLVPANTEADRALRKAIAGSPGRSVFVFHEFLDTQAFQPPS